MLKRKNIEIFTLSLTLYLLTLSFCSTSAMSPKKIYNNPFKKEEKTNNSNKQNKKTHIELLRKNSNENNKVVDDFNLKIKEIFKPVIDNCFQEHYNNPRLMEKLIDLCIQKDIFKNHIKKYEIISNEFLKYYETNSFINYEIKYFLNHIKDIALKSNCLNNEKKLDKEKFIKIIKDHIKSNVKIDCSKVNFTISKQSEKKLEEYFNKYEKNINDLLKKVQTKYNEITEKIKNNDNNKNIKEITPEIIEKFKTVLLRIIGNFKNRIKNFSEKRVENEIPLSQYTIDSVINYDKSVILDFISLTKNNKLDKNKLFTTLKILKIINNDSKYTINKEKELNLLIFLRKCKTKVENEHSREFIDNILKTSPLLKEALELSIIDNLKDTTNQDIENSSPTLFYPPIK